MPIFLDQRVLERIRAEYREMPGMKLTAEQLQRLCGIEQSVCKPILDSLVQTGFLSLRRDGTNVRLTEWEVPLPHSRTAPLKATLFSATSRRAS